MSPSTKSTIATLAALRGVNGYTDQGSEAKSKLHSAGKTFLRQVAKDLGMEKGSYDLGSNLAGIAVSGEVTLHADGVYVQLSEGCSGNGGIQMLYRSCKGRKDYCGGQNCFLDFKNLNPDVYRGFLARCQSWMAEAPVKKPAMTP